MTENGRRVRDQIEPKLDDFVNELTRMRGTVEKARTRRQRGLALAERHVAGRPDPLVRVGGQREDA